MDFTPEQQAVADAVTSAPITEAERRKYATVEANRDILNEQDAHDLIYLNENDFIRRVMRRPYVGIALREAGLL